MTGLVQPFISTVPGSLDSKGRVCIPATYRHILAAQIGDGDDSPDVELGADVDEQRDNDGERETRQVFLGEQRSLGQKGGADG